MNKKLIRKMLTASGGPIYWLRKRLYNNIEPFGYNNIGSRLYNGIILNKNEHSNFKGDYSDPERAPALYLTIDNIWGEYLHIPEKERRYPNGKYKIKNNGNGTFSLPFKSMEDIMLTVNSNNPLLWGLRGKALNSVVGEYDVHRGYDKNGDYLKYVDHWRINPYDVKEDKEYGLDNNSILKEYFKGKDDVSFGLGTPVEIQGKYYLDDIYNVKGKNRGGHYLPEIVVTGKKKQGGKMNTMKLFKNGGQVRKMQTAAGGPIKRQKDGYRYIPDKKSKGGWLKITDDAMSDVFSTLEITPNKTRTGSSITRTLLSKSSDYRSAYNPNDIIKGFNALTLGGLNNLSPTLWARRYYDLNKLLASQVPGTKRAMTWSGFVNNWLNGNNGLVSEKFAQEHPYWSMAINGAGDVAALGGIANANKINLVGNIATKHGGDAAKIAIDVAKNSSKPFNWKNYKFLGDSRFYSDLDDVGYKTLMSERLSGNYPLTFAERKNYVTGLKNDIQKGVNYAIDEARANLKTPLKPGKEVEYTFNGGRGWRLDPYSPEDILPLLIHYGTLRATKKYGQTPWEGDYGAFQNKTEGLFFPFRDLPNTLRTHSMFLDAGERISTGAHETRHTVQSYFDVPLTEKRYDMPGTYGRYTNKKLPLDFKKKVNSYINDALTAGEWEGSLSEMDSELTGWSAKYGFPRYSQMNPQQKALLHDLFLKRFGGTSDYKNYGEISSLLKLNPDYNTSLLYSKILDDSKIGQIILGLETLGYRKQGGKMNILEFLKNGSGIHIKEKNKGKFTSYCGGKVTDECILKGKNSSNPAIRKRATFAANARKWKHLTGGTLVETLGGGNTITAKLKAKSNLTKRKAPDWDNLDRGYRYLTLDMKLPHDLAIALMGNVVEESLGNYKAVQKNGGGRGLIQWDGLPAPSGRYELWGKIWASVAKPANVYDKATDTVKNYWGPYKGLKGEQVRLKFIKAPLKEKVGIYSNSYLRAGNPRNAARYLSAMQLDSIYNPKIKDTIVLKKVGGKIDFLSLGGWFKNTFNNVSSFLGSDKVKSALSLVGGAIGLGNGISNSGKIVDLANAAKEAVNERREIDKRTQLNQHFLNILNEELLNPIIEVNGSPIHTNGVDISNRAYNKAINTFSFDDSKYNQEIQLIDLLAQQAQGLNASLTAGAFGSLIDSIAGSFLNKKSTTPKTSLVITGSPDSSKQVITTNSGMSGTVDDWRKAILG